MSDETSWNVIVNRFKVAFFQYEVGKYALLHINGSAINFF